MSDIKEVASSASVREWNGLPMPRRIYSIAAVTLGISLSVLDATVANVALPTIAESLRLTSADSIWVVNAYQLAIMVSLLSFASLGEIYSYRRVFLMGVIVFTLSSVGCSMAGSFTALVVARVFQGLGAAGMMAVNMTLVRLSYPRRFLGRGLGLNATFVAIASVAGPTIAAGILSVADWPWLFLINIPIGLLAFVLGHRFLPDNVVRVANRGFSLRDGVMNALFFGSLIFSIEGYSHGMPLWGIAMLACAMLVVGYFFIRRQMKLTYPLLPIDLLKRPIFAMSFCTSICSFMAQMLALVALPFYLQGMLGYTAVHAGLLLTAWPFIIMLVAPLAGWLIERVHAGILGGLGLGLMAFGLVTLALMSADPHPVDLIWRMMLCGAGFALFQSPNNSILIASAPQSRSGSASGMLAVARLLGQTSGAALVALMFHLYGAHGSVAAFWLAAAMAAVGCILSSSRTAMTLPADLQRKK